MGNKIPPTPRISSCHRNRSNSLDEETNELISDNSFRLSDGREIDISKNSKIYKVFDCSNIDLDDMNWCILKIIHKKDAEIQKLAKSEANLLCTLDHYNIVKSHKTFESSKDICIAMEFCSKGSLKKELQKKIPLSEELIWNYMQQLCAGIKYLHSNCVIHCDLKTQNIFLCEKEELKIGDFGLSRVVPSLDALIHGSSGTLNYFPPEMKKGWYNSKRDIWALGIILYEMCYLSHPYEMVGIGEYYAKLDGISLTKWKYSQNLKDIIINCLNKDHKRRPSIFDIINSDKRLGTNENIFTGLEKFKKDIALPSCIYYLQPNSTTVFQYNAQFDTVKMQESLVKWIHFGSWCTTRSGEVIFSGGEDYGVSGSTYKFSFNDKITHEKLNDCELNSHHSLVCYENYIYSFGGTSHVCQRLNLDSKLWENLNIIIENIGITTACIGNEEIVFTGKDTNKIFYYSIDSPTNSLVSEQLPVGTGDYKLLAQGTEYIYCLCRNSLYQSPLSSRHWEFVSNIQEGNWWSPSQAICYRENIYFVTNDHENQIIWKLDCAQNTVTSVANLAELTKNNIQFL